MLIFCWGFYTELCSAKTLTCHFLSFSVVSLSGFVSMDNHDLKYVLKDFSLLQCCARVLRRIDIKYSFSILCNLSVKLSVLAFCLLEWRYLFLSQGKELIYLKLFSILSFICHTLPYLLNNWIGESFRKGLLDGDRILFIILKIHLIVIKTWRKVRSKYLFIHSFIRFR